MKKLIALITAVILSASMVSSCGKAGNSSGGHKWQNSDTLNEWQIDLLKAQGLPTDIEQLTPSQKRSIQHIYEMITYLNEKYDEEFVYAGYVEPGVMDEETLYARSLSDEKQRAVTVKINSNGDFTDDYQGKTAVDNCEKLIDNYVKSYFDSENVAYFMHLNNNDIYDLSEVKNDVFNWNIGLRNEIVFSADKYSESDVDKFANELALLLFSHQIAGTTQLSILKNVDISQLTENNYTDYYDVKYIVYRFRLSINESRVIITKSNQNKAEEYNTNDFISNLKGE